MKHAYLIIAHNNWEQLKILIRLLDSEYSDIYIHIDKKAKHVPIEEMKKIVKKSNIRILQEYKVFWGSYELVRTEMLLFERAHKKHYDYYHLLSGMDLPIKSQDKVYKFFEEHNGLEFIHFDSDQRLLTDHEIKRRTKLYHFFQNYRRRYRIKIFNGIFTFLERILLIIQLVLHVDRMKKYPGFIVKYGSQWVSITDNLVEYILSQKNLIENIFRYTNCADELFIQSLVFNSPFKEKLYDKKFDDDIHANMRLIDMKSRGKNGNPYTWKVNDKKEIMESDCLFARKFDQNIDNNIIKWIQEYVAINNPL